MLSYFIDNTFLPQWRWFFTFFCGSSIAADLSAILLLLILILISISCLVKQIKAFRRKKILLNLESPPRRKYGVALFGEARRHSLPGVSAVRRQKCHCIQKKTGNGSSSLLFTKLGYVLNRRKYSTSDKAKRRRHTLCPEFFWRKHLLDDLRAGYATADKNLEAELSTIEEQEERIQRAVDGNERGIATSEGESSIGAL
uniref:Uncharacterized protein n=1 Tax=Romanomermis culicivorax TaxID=13658 RepID=A0A915JLY1_ROMCU